MSGEETPSAHVRASRADRDRVVIVLEAAYVEGRLTQRELDERVGHALTTGRTYGELAALTADLPAHEDQPGEQLAVQDQQPAAGLRSIARPVTATLGTIAALTVAGTVWTWATIGTPTMIVPVVFLVLASLGIGLLVTVLACVVSVETWLRKRRS